MYLELSAKMVDGSSTDICVTLQIVDRIQELLLNSWWLTVGMHNIIGQI